MFLVASLKYILLTTCIFSQFILVEYFKIHHRVLVLFNFCRHLIYTYVYVQYIHKKIERFVCDSEVRNISLADSTTVLFNVDPKFYSLLLFMYRINQISVVYVVYVEVCTCTSCLTKTKCEYLFLFMPSGTPVCILLLPLKIMIMNLLP